MSRRQRMQVLSRVLLLVTAWWSLAAFAAGMGYDDAQHLLLRTGFAPTEAEVQATARLSRREAVEKILAAATSRARTPPPTWVDEPPRWPRRLKDLSEEEKQALFREEIRRSLELRAWWYREMLATPSPLTERMTLFWHNHFVSSQQKVKVAQLMYRQNQLLRSEALGNFATLLHAIARDPAMVLYLDSASNRRGQPNENFARELMELFTLGAGHYTEQDVKEAARAFTGWSLDRASGEFRFHPRLHDDGRKTVLGHSGMLDGDDVIDILLAQPATAEFIVTKLWREFVSPEVDLAEVRRLAEVFRSAHYELKPLLRALFLSDAFWARENRGALIKSPVELLVGTVHQFGLDDLDARLLAVAGRSLGQDLFAPPNVKGWPGGEAWINSTTLLARKQILARMFRAEEMPVDGRDGPMAGKGMRPLFDAARFFDGFPGGEAERRTQVQRLVLGEAPRPPLAADDRLEFLRQLVLDPAYQLK
ncbi:MAG: DUF1800 domain-containing protein [Burkholderiales bacterium]|nr:DUF1800 domain-containing protein [Burkholderiales bacterium]